MNLPVESIQDAFVIILLPVLSLAVFFDLKDHRIPNELTYAAMGLALVLQASSTGAYGVLFGLGGILVAGFVFMPFYLASGMGAGDVKLMMTVGTFLGPLETLVACGCTLIVGAILGVVVTGSRGVLAVVARRYSRMLKEFVFTGQRVYIPPTEEDVVASQPFPYAAAITLGTLAALFWFSRLEPVQNTVVALWMP